MLVSQNHLEAQEHYHEEARRWLQRYGSPLFGLLPPAPGEPSSLALNISIENNNQLRVQVMHCQALTSAGLAIHIEADSDAQQTRPTVGLLEIDPRPKQVFPVYIRATEEKDPVGEPDATGNAPRRAPRYEIILQEEGISDDGSVLKVALVEVEEFQATLSADFYPPCLTMDSVQPLQQAADDIVGLVNEVLDRSTRALASAPPMPNMSARNMAARGFLEMVVVGWSSSIETIRGWDSTQPPHFFGGIRALLGVFSRSLTAFTATREAVDQGLLQAGGLPQLAGGIDYHTAIARYIETKYDHLGFAQQVKQGRELLNSAEACLRWVAENELEESEAPPEENRLKIVYRQQNYYQLDVGKIDKSLAPDSQVLYFRELSEHSIRAVLFVLRNNAQSGIDERNIRLKGCVNDDRPLFCPDLEPDFKERSGLVYLLLEVEPGKRDTVDYISLRSPGLIDLKELLENQKDDIRLFYL